MLAALLPGLVLAQAGTEEITRRAAEILADPSAHADAAIAAEAADRAAEAKARWSDELEAIAEGGARIGLDTLAAHRAEVGQGAERPVASGAEYHVYITQTMPRGELLELAARSRESGSMTLVLRGLLPGQTLKDLQHVVWELIQPVTDGGSVPSITIDPRPFRSLGVTHAPVLARYDDAGVLLASAAGTTNPAWLDERVAGGARGDLGKVGPVVEVAERDMEEVIREQLAALDPEAIRKRMTERARSFWERAPMLDLPPVQVSAERLVDPTFVVTETIKTPDGTVLAWQGERVNPLERMAFGQRLVVVDITDPRQVALARRVLEDGSPLQTTLITVRFDREKGWDGYSEAVVDFQRPVYLLTEAMRATYHLQRVPSIVTARDLRFVIQEVGPEEWN
jgi:hypothetical protein